MTSNEIRRKFLSFFEKRGHTIVPSSSLVPDDLSVLLTTAGMQQFKPYYSELDPQTTIHPSIGKLVGKNAVSIQKCFRTSDIDEVGDETHLTFFEMLGNFSFGGYFKKEAITYAFEFLTKELGLKISYVTIFKGSHGVPKDEESRGIWNSLGIKDVREEGIEDVFWGPTGSSGPCGPTTEIYCKTSEGKDVEIWNIVFNQFFYPGSREELLSQAPGKKLQPLKTPGVDTGMGLERLAMIAQNKNNIFETDLFNLLINLLPESVSYAHRRIIVDHLKASAFLIADGIRPSNKGVDYILRRILRRSLTYKKIYKIHDGIFEKIIEEIINIYGSFYRELDEESKTIIKEFSNEDSNFTPILDAGIRKLHQLIGIKERDPANKFAHNYRPDFGSRSEDFTNAISGKEAFNLHQSLGLPTEIIEAILASEGYTYHKDEFKSALEEARRQHQEISRAGQEKKFGGHGLILNTGELKAANEEELKKVTRLHTATHLLQAALRKVLGNEAHQMGSDITAERTRFDFSFPRKLTVDEIKKTEDLINSVVEKALPMNMKKMKFEDAKRTGALYFFKDKYPDEVNVYYAGDSIEEAFSKEFCGGPHVKNTSEVGTFKIMKEEAVSAGVRRIRADVL